MSQIARYLAESILCLTFAMNACVAGAQVSEDEDLGERLQRQASELEKALEENRIDYATDTLDAIFAKRDAATALLERHEEEILASYFDTAIVALNYPVVRIEASPRLSGRVVRVGPSRAVADLPAALGQAQDGDIILLDEGGYSLSAQPNRGGRLTSLPLNLTIIGAGKEKTTLITTEIAIQTANLRLRLEGLRLECSDSPLTDFRRSEGLHLRDCFITGYNSGAGGSNAISGSGGSVFLIENCIFEGMTGRSSAGGRRTDGGDAFDLRGNHLLFCRQTQFIDNSQISRANAPEVYDGCVSMNSTRFDSGIMTYLGGPVLLRNNAATLSDRDNRAIHFRYSGDDLAVVEAAADSSIQANAEADELIRRLALHRNLPYWIGLIRHENPQIRAIAAEQITKLTGQEASSNTDGAKEGETLADLGALFAAEQEFTRLITWYETNRERLRWDDAAGRYILEDSP